MSEMTIRTTVDIDAPATEAWTVFGERFADWADWAPGIDSSTLEGPLAEGVIRVNETPSLGAVRQRLARFDPSNRALAYEMGAPLPPMFSSVRNDWTITELDAGRCRLEGEALFVLTERAAPMRPQLEGKMGVALEVFAASFRDRMQAGRDA
ncbi:MAG: hypothetical protein ACI8PZ_000505 [Myxococcota bacterium]|jgi:hypothetical protein